MSMSNVPNCPVCGKEVQASTDCCPACGTNLKQTSFNVPTSNYPPVYPNHQQGRGTPREQPHGHKKYILAIVVAAIVGLLVGGVIGVELPVAPDVTLTSQNHGTPSTILFGSADTGNLSSTVFSDRSYEFYLPIGDNYIILIQLLNMTSGPYFGTHTCPASPSTFSSSDANATQNFAC